MEIDVSPSGIRSHASTLTGIQGRVSDAAGAADTTLDSEAFGLVNAFLAAGATFLGLAFTTALENEAEDIGETVLTLQQMAKNHEATDDNASSRVLVAGS
ncbi:MAG: hypothetical protein ABIQ92_05360 [Ornithinibacter sp.]